MERFARPAVTYAGLALLAAAALVAPDSALMVAPAWLLLVALLTGRRPGERLIERYRRVPAAPAPPRRPAAIRRAPRAVLRGGRLIASGLAMRPPPAVPSSLR